jgi:hypothetical protein
MEDEDYQGRRRDKGPKVEEQGGRSERRGREKHCTNMENDEAKCRGEEGCYRNFGTLIRSTRARTKKDFNEHIII